MKFLLCKSEVVRFARSEVLLVPRKVKLSSPQGYFSLAPQAAQTSLRWQPKLHCLQLHSPQANLVVESACETHDTFDVGRDSKRSQTGLKMGVVIP